jgi:hypothetical protein
MAFRPENDEPLYDTPEKCQGKRRKSNERRITIVKFPSGGTRDESCRTKKLPRLAERAWPPLDKEEFRRQKQRPGRYKSLPGLSEG